MDNIISNARNFRDVSNFYRRLIRDMIIFPENSIKNKKRSAIRNFFGAKSSEKIRFFKCNCNKQCNLIKTNKTKPYINNGKWICCE